MQFELNKNMFRRLVKLIFVVLAACLAAVAYELSSPKWTTFSDDFDALATKHFGTATDAVLIVAGGVGLVSVVWSIASLIGLLSFRRWARWGSWASLLLFVPLTFIPGFYPYYTTPLYDFLAILSSALFGAVMLLAYSRDHGAIWFERQISEDGNN